MIDVTGQLLFIIKVQVRKRDFFFFLVVREGIFVRVDDISEYF